MRITCTSDLHGSYPKLPGGDLLILSGDYTAQDKVNQWGEFYSWLRKQDYKKKVMIAGNHDNFLFDNCSTTIDEHETCKQIRDFEEEEEFFDYLCDSGIEYEGLKIWGSPWTAAFDGMNPSCMAFTLKDEYMMDEKFSLIPQDTNILICHTPPIDILDHCKKKLRDWVLNHSKEKEPPIFYGSRALMKKIVQLNDLKLFVCGHIHEGYGKDFLVDDKDLKKSIPFINCAHMNRHYQPVNPPITIEIK